MGKLEEQLKDTGWEYTLVDCEDNSATQVSQVENFITSGCDLIMVHPSDAAALENVCKEVDIPVYAIGGITAEKMPQILGTGAAGGCMMSGFMQLKEK